MRTIAYLVVVCNFYNGACNVYLLDFDD